MARTLTNPKVKVLADKQIISAGGFVLANVGGQLVHLEASYVTYTVSDCRGDDVVLQKDYQMPLLNLPPNVRQAVKVFQNHLLSLATDRGHMASGTDSDDL